MHKHVHVNEFERRLRRIGSRASSRKLLDWRMQTGDPSVGRIGALDSISAGIYERAHEQCTHSGALQQPLICNYFDKKQLTLSAKSDGHFDALHVPCIIVDQLVDRFCRRCKVKRNRSYGWQSRRGRTKRGLACLWH